MTHHKDRETNSAIIRLLDCLCELERNTGNRTTLLLIPHNIEENLVLAQDGKPIWGQDVEPIVKIALNERYYLRKQK